LYRANKNVSDIKTIFDFYHIDYTIFSRDQILDDPNIRNLLNILRVIYKVRIRIMPILYIAFARSLFGKRAQNVDPKL
jgi:superfamily I DNA/RNA helicase